MATTAHVLGAVAFIPVIAVLIAAMPPDAAAGEATATPTPIDCVHFIAMDQGAQRTSIDAALARAPLELTGSNQVDVVSVERACLQGSGTVAAAVDRVRIASSPNTLLLDGSGRPLRPQ